MNLRSDCEIKQLVQGSTMRTRAADTGKNQAGVLDFLGGGVVGVAFGWVGVGEFLGQDLSDGNCATDEGWVVGGEAAIDQEQLAGTTVGDVALLVVVIDNVEEDGQLVSLDLTSHFLSVFDTAVAILR